LEEELNEKAYIVEQLKASAFNNQQLTAENSDLKIQLKQTKQQVTGLESYRLKLNT